MPRPESKFYAAVRSGLHRYGFEFFRVENKLDSSLPDAFYTGPSTSGWIEFKVAEFTKGRWAIDWAGRKKQLMTIRAFEKAGVRVLILAKCDHSLALGFGHPITGPSGWPVVLIEPGESQWKSLAKCIDGKGSQSQRLFGLEAKGLGSPPPRGR